MFTMNVGLLEEGKFLELQEYLGNEYVLQYEKAKIICLQRPKKRFGQKKLVKKITRFLKSMKKKEAAKADSEQPAQQKDVIVLEKEKNEVRYAKVLKILETKDLQIQQLEREKVILNDDNKQKEDEMKAYGLRLHDLLIEKTELQENMDSMRIEYEEKIKSITEENNYLSQVVEDGQVRLEINGDYAKEQTALIQKLLSLQDQIQTVINVQEERLKSEVSGLNEQLKDSNRLRETLEADIEHSKLQEN